MVIYPYRRTPLKPCTKQSSPNLPNTSPPPSMPSSQYQNLRVSSSLVAGEKTGSGNSSYRLYWSSLYTATEGSGAQGHGCTTPSDGVSLMNNSNCLFSSVCGMGWAAEGASDWETLPNGASHSFEVRQQRGVTIRVLLYLFLGKLGLTDYCRYALPQRRNYTPNR